MQFRPSMHVSQTTINNKLRDHELGKCSLQANKMGMFFEFIVLREGRCTLWTSMDQMCEGEGLQVEALLGYENLTQGVGKHCRGMRIGLGEPQGVWQSGYEYLKPILKTCESHSYRCHL